MTKYGSFEVQSGPDCQALSSVIESFLNKYEVIFIFDTLQKVQNDVNLGVRDDFYSILSLSRSNIWKTDVILVWNFFFGSLWCWIFQLLMNFMKFSFWFTLWPRAFHKKLNHHNLCYDLDFRSQHLRASSHTRIVNRIIYAA